MDSAAVDQTLEKRQAITPQPIALTGPKEDIARFACDGQPDRASGAAHTNAFGGRQTDRHIVDEQQFATMEIEIHGRSFFSMQVDMNQCSCSSG